ncbi:MAG TPA: AI-2E family transporter [Rhodanobacteraceae bacterium]|nr:AI-2E family transporter [Rhodanobacteraceae bacterium]
MTQNDPTEQTIVPAAAPPAEVVVREPVAEVQTEVPVEEIASAPRLRNRLQIAIVVILTLYTCAIAEAVVVPVLIAVLLGLMLAPPVRLLERSHVPRAISSLFMVLLAIAILGGAIMALASPARAWIARMPTALVHIQSVAKDLRRPFQAATEATRELGKITQMDESNPVRVVDTGPSPMAAALSAAPAVIAGIVITIVLTFLFLLHGDELLRKFVTLAPHLRAKRDLVEATRTAQSEISMYVITVTLINAGLGLATAAALWLLNVRDPLLWGGVAALLNYAPFIGPMVTAVALVVVGFGGAATPALALAPAAAFLGLHLLEGQLLTPHLVGRRLALDPVMVFIAMLVLGWMWGVAGFLLAVPLLTCAKIIGERIDGGEPMVALLSRHE